MPAKVFIVLWFKEEHAAGAVWDLMGVFAHATAALRAAKPGQSICAVPFGKLIGDDSQRQYYIQPMLQRAEDDQYYTSHRWYTFAQAARLLRGPFTLELRQRHAP